MKLKTAIWYQLCDIAKPVAIYYVILYTVAAGITAIAVFVEGSSEAGTISGMETSSVIFLMFCGVYAFLEDFRFFIQNGLTRKTIFKSQMILFFVVTAFMGTWEMIVEGVIGGFIGYHSMFQMIYGDGAAVWSRWIWQVSLYLMVANLAFLSTVIQNRIGKRPFLLIVFALCLIFVLLIPAINVAVDGRLANAVLPFLIKIMGVTENGIQIVYPIFTFLGITAATMAGTYGLLRRAEVR